jgi:hypothetical protein
MEVVSEAQVTTDLSPPSFLYSQAMDAMRIAREYAAVKYT